MTFRTDEPGVHASRTGSETGSAHIGELDLYDELATFSALSPEQQRKELESLERHAAQPALTVEDSSRVSFDFLEQSDFPTRGDGDLDRSAEPVFNLIDESQLERVEQSPSWQSAEPAFAFVEESSKESSLSSGASQTAPALPDRSTSPLEVIDSGAMTSARCELRCESCGAESSPEDLFCLSCGQLLGGMD